ncbi:Phage integrase family protein [Neorhodopirellula lusitana]|uniref:Phage integrase family protein n=1 Tax=Neorhodopirellula lusitana TaxID=445327 RepID=A0ABY1QSR4_9BACT|nr:tyrosine-type recombinase/integrase [Neorhodopirellula lusitana]SMP77905.1 Phage integrase family protein [Neorhodopirellula lusitana]
MATIQADRTDGKLRYRVCFQSTDGQRKRLRLDSKTRKRDAEGIARKIEDLLSVKANNGTVPPSVLDWLAGVPLSLRVKLRDANLLPEHVAGAIERMTVAAWFKRYLKERPDIKAGTREQIEISGRNLVAYLGDDKTIDRVTAADAKRWRGWMLTQGNERKKGKCGLAEDTVRRRTGRAKQVFGEAVERGMIVVNPFSKLPSASRVNTTRQRFIDIPTITKVIEEAPSTEWRTIIALARFGGLRIPSELSTLRWDRVSLPQGRITIQAPKTEHHRDGGLRVMPIFPELRPFVEAAWDVATPGAVYVIETAKRRNARNLGTELGRMIERAGVERWPKAFQNLRASRETELLAAGYPAKDVASWLGNSVPVAMKHYAMATAEQFERAMKSGATPIGAVADEATAEGENSGSGVGHTGGAFRGAQGQNPDDNVQPENEKSPQFAGLCGSVSVGDETLSYPART